MIEPENKRLSSAVSRIQLLATGGTIASRFSEATQDVRVESSGDDLARALAARHDNVEVIIEDVLKIASFEMDLETAMMLVKRIECCLRRHDVSGVVVTQGTDTMEETAYLADLLVNSDKPVVFTGAQRAADEPESDGPRNLRNAIAVAASPDARGRGTLVVFDGEIHFARDVVKVHTTRLTAFESPDLGKAGEIDRDSVIFYREGPRRRIFRHRKIDTHVDLIKLTIGADGRFVDCAVETGARGIVLEAFGRGNATPEVLDAVRRAVQSNVIVVVTSRCGRGRVAPVYGGSGGASLARAGVLFCGRLTGLKARILLAVLLGRGGTRVSVGRGLKWLAV